MRQLLLALPLLAGGCGAISDAIAPAYVAQPIKVFDQAKYQADVALCSAAGAAWKPQSSLGSAISKTIDGATSNTSLIPLSPLVPLYGAAGGAIGAAGDGLDLASRSHGNVTKNCLLEITHRDGSALLADPRD